jgi:uncharacterized protein
MRSIYVMGTYSSGKTAICAALALRLKDEGRQVAYFKPVWSPVAAGNREDDDAVLMRSLLGLGCTTQEISLYAASPYYLTRYEKSDECVQRVLDTHHRMCSTCDMVIVEGTASPHLMSALGMDAVSLAGKLGTPALLVNKVDNDYSLDDIILFCDNLKFRGVELIGVIMNNVPRQILDKCEGIYRPILEQRGYPVLGIIPKRLEITAPTVREFRDVLEGEVLTGEDYLDKLVEDVQIGAMTLESALRYMRRATNKAVITGGDRSDICLAAIETNTSALILTGGLYPNVAVIARAEEKGIPILLVRHDTYTTVQRLHEVSRKLAAHDVEGLDMVRRGFDAHVDWSRLRAGLEDPTDA